MYAASLWNYFLCSSYNRIRVAYNNAYRILHGLSKRTNARENQIFYNIITFDALIRKALFRFIQRCYKSSNCLIKAVMQSDAMWKSNYFTYYEKCLFQGEG